MTQAHEPLTPLTEGAEYALLSSGDASAFVLRFKTDGVSAHLQGEDAARFRMDYEAIKVQFPTWPADQTLAQLWDQGGYSWLATEDKS